jgi:hypothetical protein
VTRNTRPELDLTGIHVGLSQDELIELLLMEEMRVYHGWHELYW